MIPTGECDVDVVIASCHVSIVDRTHAMMVVHVCVCLSWGVFLNGSDIRHNSSGPSYPNKAPANGSVVSVTVDVQQHTLSFAVDGHDYGVGAAASPACSVCGGQAMACMHACMCACVCTAAFRDLPNEPLYFACCLLYQGDQLSIV
jgi:hypothetical protein